MDIIKLEQLIALFSKYAQIRVYDLQGESVGTFNKNDFVEPEYANAIVKDVDVDWVRHIMDIVIETPDYSERMFKFSCPFAGNWNKDDVVPVKPLGDGQVLVDGVAQMTSAALEGVGKFVTEN